VKDHGSVVARGSAVDHRALQLKLLIGNLSEKVSQQATGGVHVCTCTGAARVGLRQPHIVLFPAPVQPTGDTHSHVASLRERQRSDSGLGSAEGEERVISTADGGQSVVLVVHVDEELKRGASG